MMRANTAKAKVPLWIWPLAFCYLLYFGVLIFSEAFLPGQSIDHLQRKRYIQGGLLVVAFVLVRSYPQDLRARLGALLLAAVGTAPLFPPPEMRAVWRSLPGEVSWVLWVPQMTHILLLPIFFTFHGTLPRPLFSRGWHWLLIWAPALVASWWPARALYRRIHVPGSVEDVPTWILFATGAAILAYGFGALIALFVNYTRLAGAEERTRMRVLLVGLWLGWAPGLIFLTAIFWGPLTSSKLVWWLVVPPWRTFALFMWVIVPIALLYAVLWKRIFDLPLHAREVEFQASYLTKL